MAYMPNYEAYGAGNYSGRGIGSTGGAGAAAGAGANFAAAVPYIQAILSAYTASRGDSGTQKVERAFASAARSKGLNPVTPDQPGNQSVKRRVGRSIGQSALGFIPIVGPILSAAAGVYHSNIDSKAKERYLSKILAANPEMSDPGRIGLKSEYVPQGNFLSRYFSSQPKHEQKVMRFAKKIGSIGGHFLVKGEKDVKKKQEYIHQQNLRKIKEAEEGGGVTEQDALVRKRTMQMAGGGGIDPQMKAAILQQLLAPQGWQALGRGIGNRPPQLTEQQRAINERGY